MAAHNPFRTADLAALAVALVAALALLAASSGCAEDGSHRRYGYDRPVAEVRTTAVLQDDYDYYPGYETYYSRNRHEYVYREGNAWVRRPAPAGVSLSLLLASPAVHVDFHDSPERHHNDVARKYPRNWRPSGQDHDDRKSHVDNRDVRRDDDRNDHR